MAFTKGARAFFTNSWEVLRETLLLFLVSGELKGRLHRFYKLVARTRGLVVISDLMWLLSMATNIFIYKSKIYVVSAINKGTYTRH